MKAKIDTKRLAKVTRLDGGAHNTFSDGMCVMEAVAYVAGRSKITDHPPCASPVIGAFLRSWNDALPGSERTSLLLPLVPLIVNTVGSPSLEERRSLMAADWLIRTHTVAWLRLAKLDRAADALANLPEITAMAQIPSIRGPIEAARSDASAAWATAGAAAGDAAGAARAAAGDAAGAAGDAAWAAAGAAGAAAGAAARDAGAAAGAAGAAAWAAAWDAARDALKETRATLQRSAVALVERMCALTDDADRRTAA